MSLWVQSFGGLKGARQAVMKAFARLSSRSGATAIQEKTAKQLRRVV